MTEAANLANGHTGEAKFGFRWFGPDRDVPIDMVRQIPGVTDIVSALHHVPNGEEWTIAEILKRKIEVEFKDEVVEPKGLQGAARDDFYKQEYRARLPVLENRTGLVWSTLESLPFTEEIKNGSPLRDEHIANYKKSLDNIGTINRILEEPQFENSHTKPFAIQSVMGNFMLVADWTRTHYEELRDGSKALAYDHERFMAFDIFMAKRHADKDGQVDFSAYQKDGSYSAKEIESAKIYWETKLKDNRSDQESLANMIVAGLPGAQASFGPNDPLEKKLDIFREAVLKYEGMTVADLRENIDYFLKAVVPNAKAAGVMLCSHPDDPAYSPFLGTPRAVGDVAGYKFLLDRDCGVGLCFGSLTPNEGNRDVMGVIKELADHGLARGMTIEQVFPHVHLRPVETDGKNFKEGRHADHVDELSQITYALTSYGWKGVFRPDHAPNPSSLHSLIECLAKKADPLGDALAKQEKFIGDRGYTVPGRAMGGSLLAGLFHEANVEVTGQAKAVDTLIVKGHIRPEQRDQALEDIRTEAYEARRRSTPQILVPPTVPVSSAYKIA
ncbi:MAG: mannonate dehydratase [Pseudomonadota bacterium]|nr:mannonate dehydratase [Pseudomonadota bacterium]